VTEEVAEDAFTVEQSANVRTLDNGWSLIEYGGWSVSVGPDGLLMLPRHLAPEEVGDFVGACLAAAEVGKTVQAINAKRAAGDDRSLPESMIQVSDTGTVPAGAFRLATKTGSRAPVQQAAISRRVQPSQQGLRSPMPRPPLPQ
jgi:hypothetical protein